MFYVWIDESQIGSQVETANEFAVENQRISGFQAGDVISSKIVNTAVRQANLIAVALMQSLGVSNDFSVISTVDNLATEISNKLSSIIGGPYVPTNRTIADNALSSDISAQTLTDSLIYCNETTDVDYIIGD